MIPLAKLAHTSAVLTVGEGEMRTLDLTLRPDP
jgi:hypothetical protein